MLILRLMARQDLRPLLEMAAAEDWLSDEEEFNLMLAKNPYGCFTAAGEDGVLGGIMTFAYGQCAWIGNFIVDTGLRGRGIGSRLMQKAIDYLKDKGFRNIYLCAALKAAPLYRRFGFREVTLINRWRGNPAPADEIFFLPGLEVNLVAGKIIPLDTYCWGDDRSGLLAQLIQHRVCFHRPDGSGFIMYGHIGGHTIIGPWSAAGGSRELAEGLLKVVLAQNKVKDHTCFLDVPENNVTAGRILAEAGFQKFNARYLMCLGEPPEIVFSDIFALASLGSMG